MRSNLDNIHMCRSSFYSEAERWALLQKAFPNENLERGAVIWVDACSFSAAGRDAECGVKLYMKDGSVRNADMGHAKKDTTHTNAFAGATLKRIGSQSYASLPLFIENKEDLSEIEAVVVFWLTKREDAVVYVQEVHHVAAIVPPAPGNHISVYHIGCVTPADGKQDAFAYENWCKRFSAVCVFEHRINDDDGNQKRVEQTITGDIQIELRPLLVSRPSETCSAQTLVGSGALSA